MQNLVIFYPNKAFRDKAIRGSGAWMSLFGKGFGGNWYNRPRRSTDTSLVHKCAVTRLLVFKSRIWVLDYCLINFAIFC